MSLIEWIMYFVWFSDNFVHLGKVKNKTASSEKTISWEDWYGKNYETNDFSNNCVELWAYNRPAESYLPLFYLPVTGSFSSSVTYYQNINGIYFTWDTANYDPATWETVRSTLVYFDEVTYENELISLLERSNYPKTYVLRDLGPYSDKASENDTDRVEPACGKASYRADSKKITFENTAQTRYVFKLVKYED